MEPKPTPPPGRKIREESFWELFSPAFLPVMLMLTLVLFALVGCGATPVDDSDFVPTPVTFNIVVPYQCGQPQSVSVVVMRDVVWDIITVNEKDLFTLTVDDYKALGLNTSDWIAASGEMRAQRDFYRDCIVRSQEETHDENLDAGLVSDIPTDGS